MSTPFAYLRYR